MRDAGELRPELEPRAARMLVLGALNWAAEWWNPRRGSLEQVIRTAKVIVRNGLSAEISDSTAAPARTRARRGNRVPH